MRREISEEECYSEIADYLSRSKRGTIIIATKTPTLLLLKELCTPGREDYHREHIRARTTGRVAGLYAIAWQPTVEGLPILFSPNKGEREAQSSQLKEALSLVQRGLVQLRWSPNIDFPSGMASSSLVMIHHKDATGLNTEFVEVITGGDVIPASEPFVRLAASLYVFDDASLARMINKALVLAGVQRAQVLRNQSFRDIADNLDDICHIAAEICRSLRLPVAPGHHDIRPIIDHLPVTQKNDFCEFLKEHPETCRSPSGQQLLLPRKCGVQGFLPLPGVCEIPTLHFRTVVPSGCSGHVRLKLTQPFILLEAYLAAPEDHLYPIDGFFLFPTWRDRKKGDFRKRFDDLHRKLRHLLRKISPRLDVRFESDRYGGRRLGAPGVPSDVGGAAGRLKEAKSLLKEGKPTEAERLLVELVMNFPCLPEAAVLLVECWGGLSDTGRTYSLEVAVAAADILNVAIQAHEQALSPLSGWAPADDPGVYLHIRTRGTRLGKFRDARAAIIAWLKEQGQDSSGRDELDRIRQWFERMASEKCSAEGQDSTLKQLVNSPFGRRLDTRLAEFLRKAPSSLEVELKAVAPKVINHVFKSPPALERYLVKTLMNRLKESARCALTGLSPKELKQVDALRRAEEHLLQESGGVRPSDDDLCHRLRWCLDRLLEVRERSRQVPYDDRTDSRSSYSRWKSGERSSET